MRFLHKVGMEQHSKRIKRLVPCRLERSGVETSQTPMADLRSVYPIINYVHDIGLRCECRGGCAYF